MHAQFQNSNGLHEGDSGAARLQTSPCAGQLSTNSRTFKSFHVFFGQMPRPVSKQFTSHPFLFIYPVGHRLALHVFKTAWVLHFPNDEQWPLLSARHVAAHSNSQVIFACLSTMSF